MGTGKENVFVADVVGAQGYYPFGMIMPNSQNITSSVGYRYGFNGKEKDDEIKGSGNSYDFGARIYDSRLGRWLSIDPLSAKYPSINPYAGIGNNPILYVDNDGKEIWIYYQITQSDGTTVQNKVQYINGALYEEGGSPYTGSNPYVNSVLDDLNIIKTSGPEARRRLDILESSTLIHGIKTPERPGNRISFNGDNADNGRPTGSTTQYDPTQC